MGDPAKAQPMKAQKPETMVELSTPQSKGKFMKWSGSKAKDFVSSAVSAIAAPEFVKGKPVVAWLKVEVHEVVVWQVEQSDVGKPAAT